MIFSRVRCHFCGCKQPHPKSVLEFQCTECEAVNYLDGKGDIVDTPYSAAQADSSSRPLSFTKPPPKSLQHPPTQSFCRTCRQNQLLYNEALANYLPEESHPEYRKFEKALPQYKAELEQRYPLVCKKCAPTAQSRISTADHYGLAQNAARLAAATRARGGLPAYRTRDDWEKRIKRYALRFIGLILWMSILIQVVFHGYGILQLVYGTRSPEPEFAEADDLVDAPVNFSHAECARQSLGLRFYAPCYDMFSALIPYAIAVTTCGLWYNSGMSTWYHHTKRIESIRGQGNYFLVQVILLLFRSFAWVQLSNSSFLESQEQSKLIGFHAGTIFTMLLVQMVVERGIQPVLWTIKGKMMPKPEQEDLFRASAGPAEEEFIPQRSEHDPWKYLRKDSEPFDINSLAPKAQKKPTYTRTSHFGGQQPSPEHSDDGESLDAMETDFRPIMRSSQRFTNTHAPDLRPRPAHSLGFSSMTDEVFGMDAELRREQNRQLLEQQQKLRYEPPAQSSPFRGTLPPAPMSMERRLRNPVIRPVEAPSIALSQQKDFMNQMRRGVKPVRFPEKGSNFELRQSSWVLPNDNKELGLEDRFQKHFTLSGSSEDQTKNLTQKSGLLGGLFGF